MDGQRIPIRLVLDARAQSTGAARLLATLRGWLQADEQRKQLLELEEHELKDIGITREQALQEGAKRPWR